MKAAPNLGFSHRFETGTDPLAPTLLLLHGTGGDENDLISLGQTIAPGSSLLSPRGKILENGMPRFFRRLAEGVFDLDDLAQRTSELARFLEAAANKYGFPLDRLIAVGFSNGANIAASLLLSFPQTLAAAIFIRAMVPFVPDTLPGLEGKSVLLLSGQLDPIVPHRPAGATRRDFQIRRRGSDPALGTGRAHAHASRCLNGDGVAGGSAHRARSQAKLQVIR